MTHPIFSALLALGMSSSLLAHAADIKGVEASRVARVYPAEANGSTPVFTLERTVRATGNTSVLTERFKDMDGSTAALLKSTYVGGEMQSIDFEQSQSKESASALFKNGRVFFTQTENGSTRTSDQAVEGKWVALSAVPDEITRNWDAVTGGKPLEFTIPVPVMRDHFAFKVYKQRSWTDNGRQLTEFKMQPASMVIRLVADAFYYVFDDQSRSLVEYRGVIIAKTLDNGKLKDMKARVSYLPTTP